MKRFLVAATCLLALLVPALDAAATSPASSPDFAELDAFVESTMNDRGIPGVALAVVEDGRVVHEHGFGFAGPSGRPVTPQTLFRIGSNTKGFTALAIMQLVEQGKVELDAPVQRYLPWFRLADLDASAHITVEELLHHTSGIPGSALYDSFTDPGLTLDQYGHDLARVHTDRPVGSAYEYSNANYDLAGLIVQAVSGQSYADYVQQHIFDPLQMVRSTASAQGEARQGLAQGYTWLFGFGPFPADDAFSGANLPAGYLSSTAEDLSHYLVAQLNGGRYGSSQILSADGMARMHVPGPNTQNAGGSGYAMGWGIGVRNGVRIADHVGETMRFISRQTMDLDNGRGVIVLTNATNQLPSDDEPFRTLSLGLIDRLESWPPSPAAPTLHVQYAVLDVVLAALSIVILWSLGRLPRWMPPTTRRGWVLSWLEAVLAIGIALGVIVFAPSVLQSEISWRSVLASTPDFGWWALIFACLLLVTGFAHALLLGRVVWRRRRASAPAGGTVPRTPDPGWWARFVASLLLITRVLRGGLLRVFFLRPHSQADSQATVPAPAGGVKGS